MNEDERLKSLYSLKILDTNSDETFDKITRLLKTALKVPIVLISLVDKNRQWFKTCIGLDVKETSREVSFCSDAIKYDNLYIVTDASLDPKYCNNALVLENPKIRFYAGKPICGPFNQKIGTICVIDRNPRNLNQDQLELIEICANLVESEIKKYHLEKQIQAIEGSQFVIVFSMDGIIKSANQKYLDLMEYEITEVQEKHHRMLVPNPEDEQYVSFWRELKKGNVQSGEYKRMTKKGKEVWLQGIYTPILDMNGIPIKVIKYAIDITTQKQQRIEIERYCRQLEHNEEKMNSVSAVISHDLINSLSPIVTLSQILLNYTTIDAYIKRNMEIIHQSANDALVLSRDLLDAYKLDLNKLKINKEFVKVSHLLKRYNGTSNIKIEYLNVTSEDLVFVDRMRVEQVISNLVVNAEDFADSILITVKKHSDYIHFSVQDNGIGIPKEKRNLLFQEFAENIHENVKRRKARTGLGLFICKRLIELHGGSIWLDENTTVGACFCFTLPN